ncbi:MAG: prepilin-type N-terminal cleavage/methylation domain-containing protein [Bacilli bacterium]
MKKTNGFTLIELLAVIVILAIIAVIATPIILGVINSAKKNAAASSAAGFVQSIISQVQFSELGIEGYPSLGTIVNNSNKGTVKSSGKIPEIVKVNINTNGTYGGCLKVDNYSFLVSTTGTVSATDTVCTE